MIKRRAVVSSLCPRLPRVSCVVLGMLVSQSSFVFVVFVFHLGKNGIPVTALNIHL